MKQLYAFVFLLIFVLSNTNSYSQANRRSSKGSIAYRNNYFRLHTGATSRHTVEIRNGFLWVSGNNEFGQLGDGSTTDKLNPIKIGSSNDWAMAVAGYGHTLAIKTNGTLWAWGYNGNGELGDGSNTDRLTPVQVGSDTTWISVTVGYNNSFGIKSNGTLWSWGYNNIFGQLGLGTSAPENQPRQVGSDNKWMSVSAGRNHTIGIKCDGTLWTWGYNAYGQLGNGTTTFSNTPIKIGSDSRWVYISAGDYYSTGIKSNGTLWAWGQNPWGNIGDGSQTDRTSPVQIGSDNKWVSVSAGAYHTLGIKSNGTLWGWGINNNGQLANGTYTFNYLTPTKLNNDSSWVKIYASFYCSIGIKANGTIWGLGFNALGQFGDSTNLGGNYPIKIRSDNNVLQISAGLAHATMIRTNGTLWAWGNNSHSELGDGTTTQRNSPKQIGLNSNWISVSAGEFHTLAIKADGTLWAWGDNAAGQLGDGTNSASSTPKQIGSDTTWISIAAGDRFSLGIKANGSLWSWGLNTFGQLGDGTTNNRNAPARVGSDDKWINIAAGTYHSLAIKSDGSLWAWGDNSTGQLGDGSNTQRTNPNQVGSDNLWVGISAGAAHSLGLKNDGTAWGWGYNAAGQIGDGSTTQRISPVQIGTSTTWLELTTGDVHSLGIKATGSLHAWGHNAFSKLGDGTTNNQTSPLYINANSGVASISAGSSYSMTIKSDRTLFCSVGYNGNGQLGDGSTTNASTYICNNSSSLLVMTVPATRVTYTSAIIGGIINPDNLSTTVSFEYGLTTSYGSTANVSGTINGINNIYKTASLSGLTPGNTYHYRLKIVNNNGTIYGGDRIFVTGSNFNKGGVTSLYSVYLASNGLVYAVGSNDNGQLGDGTTTQRNTPVKVLKGDYNGTTYLGDNPSNPIIAVATGFIHSIALAADGSVYTFGSNTYGQLGNGTTTQQSTPVRVLKGGYNGTTYIGDNSSNPIISINAGSYHTLLLALDGSVYTFGYNNSGQLGINNKVNKTSPVRVLRGSYTGNNFLGDNSANPIIAISGGHFHSMVLTADGTVYTFGYNVTGVIGDNTTIDKTVPTQVLNGAYNGSSYLGDQLNNPIVAISSGAYHNSALSANGLLYSFGANNYGQCGDNATTQRNTPVQVLKGAYNGTTYIGDNASNPIISVALSSSHNMVLTQDGAVYTFGYNSLAALGDNTYTDRLIPVRVLKGNYGGTTYLGDSTTNPIIAIASGFNKTIGLASTGYIYNCGNNDYGQLGDNTITTREVPIKVSDIGGSGYLNLLVSCSAPSAPTNTTSNANKNICTGSSTTLSASGTGTLGWYSAASGGTYLGGGTTYNTSVLTADTNFYVQDSTCTSSSRTLVHVTVNPTAAAGTASANSNNVCIGNPVNLSLTSYTGTLQWQANTGSGWNNIGAANANPLNNQTVNVNTQYRAYITATCGVDSSNVVSVTTSTCGTSLTNSNWSNANTWGGTVPTGSTNVFINSNVTINSTVSSNNLTINSGDTLAIGLGGNLNINGKFVIKGTLIMTGGTINLNSCDTIPATTYWQLKLNAPCDYILGGPVFCSNNFLIPNAGTSLKMNGYNLQVAADVTHNGTMSGQGRFIVNRPSNSASTLTGNGTFGHVELNNVGGLRQTGNNTITDSLILTNGTWVIYTGATLTVGNTATSRGHIITTNGNMIGGNSSSTSSLNIYGNALAPLIANFKFSTNGSITIDRPQGVKLGANLLIGNTTTLNKGILDMNGYNAQIGTTNSALGIAISSHGSIKNTANTGTLMFYGSASAPQTYNLILDTIYNLTLNKANGLKLNNSFVANGLVILQKGNIDLNGKYMILGSTASLSENAGQTVKGDSGYIATSRIYNAALSNNNIAGMGLKLSTNGAPGLTYLVRGHQSFISMSGSSIKRGYAVNVTNNVTATTFEFNYDSTELAGANRSKLRLNQSTTSGASWTSISGCTPTTANSGTGNIKKNGIALTGTKWFTASDSINTPLSPVYIVEESRNIYPLNMEVYPNPFTSDFNIDITTDKGIYTIQLIDINGRAVATQTITTTAGNTIINIPTETLAKGIYMLSITSDKETKTVRVVKQ